MPHTSKQIDPLPDEFATLEEAGAFWDTHSLADYKALLEPVDLDFESPCARGHNSLASPA